MASQIVYRSDEGDGGEFAGMAADYNTVFDARSASACELCNKQIDRLRGFNAQKSFMSDFVREPRQCNVEQVVVYHKKAKFCSRQVAVLLADVLLEGIPVPAK